MPKINATRISRRLVGVKRMSGSLDSGFLVQNRTERSITLRSRLAKHSAADQSIHYLFFKCPISVDLFRFIRQRHRAEHVGACAAASLCAILPTSNPGHSSLFAVELTQQEVSR